MEMLYVIPMSKWPSLNVGQLVLQGLVMPYEIRLFKITDWFRNALNLQSLNWA